MQKRFEPISDRCGEILAYLMSSPDIPDDPGIQFKVNLCAEEAIENVVRYAYQDGQGFLQVGTDVVDGQLVISLVDAGKPFDPLAKEDPDITLSAEERGIGGLGIFLCKQMMDEVSYRFEDGQNMLTMKIKVS